MLKLSILTNLFEIIVKNIFVIFVTKSCKKPIYLTVKDHSVSGEDFELLYNEEFDFFETHPQPSLEKLRRIIMKVKIIFLIPIPKEIFLKKYIIL